MILRRFKLVLLKFLSSLQFMTVKHKHMNCRNSCLLHLYKDSLCSLLSHYFFRLKLDDRCRGRVGRQRQRWNLGNKI